MAGWTMEKRERKGLIKEEEENVEKSKNTAACQEDFYGGIGMKSKLRGEIPEMKDLNLMIMIMILVLSKNRLATVANV